MSPFCEGGEVTYVWTGESLEPHTEAAQGPRFTLTPLDYWQWQDCMAQPDAVSKIRRTLELGLVAIDGSPQACARFVARPNATIATPVFQRITDLTLGN